MSSEEGERTLRGQLTGRKRNVGRETEEERKDRRWNRLAEKIRRDYESGEMR